MKSVHILYQLQVCQSFSNEASKVANLFNHNYDTHLEKPLTFSYLHTQNFLNRFLSRVDQIYFKIRRPKNNLLVSKFGKTTKTKTTTTKPTLYRASIYCFFFFLSKALSFWLQHQDWSIIIMINLWLNLTKNLSQTR